MTPFTAPGALQLGAPVAVTVWALGAQLGEGLTLAGAGLAALAVVALRVTHGEPLWRWGWWPFVAWMGWTLVSAAWATRSLATGAPWSVLHALFFPVAFAAWPAVPAQHRRRLLWTVLGIMAVSAAFALVQHAVVLDYGELLARLRPTHRVREQAPVGGFMAGGLQFHRLKYAHSMVFFGLALLPWAWRAAPRRARPALVGLMALLLAGLVVTFTRASWAALLTGLLVLLGSNRLATRGRVRLVAGVVAGTLLLTAALSWLGRWPLDRITAWSTAWHLWLEQPLVGVGYGGYAPRALALYGGPREDHPLLHLDAHSLFLQVLVTTGVIGAGLLALVLLRAARAIELRMTPALTALLAAGAVLGVVHNFAFHPVVLVGFALACAMAAIEDAA